MENNITDSGSRVTRSLKKRIASVDSDNSSRPGTPVAPKLSSITEISASPSRSTRMSRRNSSSGIATPVKTPAKRTIGASVITESAEIFTPSRRSTRRRSVSTNEDEATPQLSLKVPSFPALSEEIISIERNSSTAKKITRCQSKSPQEFNATFQTSSILNSSNKVSEDDASLNNSSKRRKPGPKCKTRKGDQADESSDVEISVVGKGIEEIKSKSNNITTIILTDDDSNQINNANMEIVKEQEENNTGGDSTVNIIDTLDIISDNSNPYGLKDDAFTQKTNKDDNPNEFVGLEELTENRSNKDETDKQNKKHTKGENKFLSNATTLIESINKDGVRLSADSWQESDSKKIDESMIATSERNCLVLKPDVEEKTRTQVLNISTDNISIGNKKQNATPLEEKAVSTRSLLSNEILPDQAAELLQQQKEKSDNKIEIINICTLSTYNDIDDATVCKTSSKTVDFTSNLGSDPNNKNVYPKTPVPTKAKERKTEEHISQVDTISGVEVDISETKTTPRGSNVQNLLTVQSSTPISVDTLTYASLSEIEKTLIKHDKAQSDECINTQVEQENLKDTAAAQANSVENEIQLKWINPSVKGTSMEGSKLDVMTFIENENVIQEISDVENEYSNNQSIEDGDDELESVENEYEREDDFVNEDDEHITEGNKHAREQDDFLDDEAKSVENYESGDSMESEERKEIMDNEILVDGESIGSHTTDDENNERIEEENSENEDSFIVSDNEDLQFFESSDENKQTDSNKDDDLHRDNRKKKKMYKRLQCPTESSSSDDEVGKCQLDDETTQGNIIETFKSDQSQNNSVANNDNYKQSEKGSKIPNNANKEVIDKNQSEIKFGCNTYARQSDHLLLDSSKLSDSALRLHCSAESETEEQKVDKEIDGVFRKQILCKFNHSDRFNKSVHNLNLEIEMSSAEDIQNRSTFDLIEVNSDTNNIEMVKSGSVSNYNNNNNENNIKEQLDCNDNKEGSLLVDMSVITESDDDKENEHETKSISDTKKLTNCLSTSFDTYTTHNGKEKNELQHSFSADIIPKSEGLHIRPSEISKEISILISPSPINDQTLANLQKEDVKYLENVCHVPLPLGNPLVRTRRLSLALPTNPNIEICSPYVSEPKTKTKRKSLGILPNSDFNPSQSLIDTIELHKIYNDRQVFKRKHMSKSFCGASETLDNSVIDIDVQHLNKRSKIIGEKSVIESPDNTNKKVKVDKRRPTPCQKGTRQDPKFNIQTILNRCDEILEAANQAKRGAKTSCKKRNFKLSNKQRKNVMASSLETNQYDALRRTSKDLNRKDKTKTAVTHAIKAAGKLLNKNHLGDEIIHKRLPSEVLAIEELEHKKKINKKATGNKQKKKLYHTTVTAIGDFVEIPQTPEKKMKEITYIQLPTGKVSVEPVTPKKRSVQACNGTEFRESPVTPYPIGFKVSEIPSVENNTTIGEITRKVAKRKRYYDEHFKQNILPKPQWTQSGPFIEEEIPISHPVRNARKSQFRGLSQKSEKCSVGGKYSEEVALNFKQKAMMRSDIKRSTNREVMLLREHRHTQCH
ncbi:hypothetical protein DOY81_003290 [Sarcophaga bullata]|nr:hypothetical protein DOY81_003290 [Sarcophaga bullata]